MHRSFWLALAILLVTSSISAQQQTETGLYFIGFKDKAGTPYSIDSPEAFLSERALLRRAKHKAAITELDLPVSPDYVSAVRETGAEIWLRSKWMNGVVVLANGEQYASVKALSFVDTSFYSAPSQYARASRMPKVPNLDRPAPQLNKVPVNKTFYGAGYRNLNHMKGDSLHHWGYRGAGMLVAVLDGGFPMVGFPDLLGHSDQSTVPANWDVVQQDSTAYDGGTHGTTVLSTMAAHHPFFFIGMAPDARYVLFKTENGRGEHRQEEINYAVALEIADSIGVDVANSSLGYTTFNDADMNYTYEDLNGVTSPASVAIDRAFERGMIIVTSAGNSGGDDWKYIGTPADAKHAFSIGALDRDDDRAYFSSFGPTADGRTKPDVSAPGVNVPAVSTNGRGLQGANGTSLSSPLVCGLVTCLWQAFPEATNQEILDAIRNTASQADDPDNGIGYGLPDFTAAFNYLKTGRK